MARELGLGVDGVKSKPDPRHIRRQRRRYPGASLSTALGLSTDHNSEEWFVPAPVCARTPAMSMYFIGTPTPEIEHFQVGGKGGEMNLRSMSYCEGAPWSIFGVLLPHRPALTCPPPSERTPPNSSSSLSTRSVPQGTGVGLWDGE